MVNRSAPGDALGSIGLLQWLILLRWIIWLMPLRLLGLLGLLGLVKLLPWLWSLRPHWSHTFRLLPFL